MGKSIMDTYQDALVELVKEGKITTIKQATKELHKRSYKQANDSGVNRIFENLEIKKDKATNIYGFTDERKKQEEENKLIEFLTKTSTVFHNANYLYLQTAPGYSEAVALELKKSYPEEIVGTIAQNDMLIVFTKDEFSENLNVIKTLSKVPNNDIIHDLLDLK